jgi:hypothetical protein
MQKITTAKIDGSWMAMIDHQHEGHGATEAAAIADAKKSKRSSDEDDALAAADERLLREDA